MSIYDLELAELKSRAANSIRTNSSMANVEGHIETLKAEIVKSQPIQKSVASTPTGYLYQLILQLESIDPTAPAAEQAEEAPALEVAELKPVDESWEEITDPTLMDELLAGPPLAEEDKVPTEEAPPKSKSPPEKPKRKKDKKS